MKYFEVKKYSIEMCGFDSYGHFAAESEMKLYASREYMNFCEDYDDYLSGWVDEDDYEDEQDYFDALSSGESVREITKEEYDESMKYYDDPTRPYHVG